MRRPTFPHAQAEGHTSAHYKMRPRNASIGSTPLLSNDLKTIPSKSTLNLRRGRGRRYMEKVREGKRTVVEVGDSGERSPAALTYTNVAYFHELSPTLTPPCP